jgi:uncharacterized membrane protein
MQSKPGKKQHSTENDVSNSRIETLADGVFAIVLTLLILDIKAPQATSDAELIQKLLALEPKFFTYVLSFIILGLFWFGHQLVSRYIKHSDHIHLWLSLLFLMSIAFIPFSAAVLGENGQQRSAVIVYGGNLLLSGSIRCLHWRYVTRNHRLVDPGLDARLIAKIANAFLVIPFFYTIAIATSFFSIQVSLFLYAISPLLGGLRMNSIFHHSRKSGY